MGTHNILAKKANQVETVGSVGRLRRVISAFAYRNVSTVLNVNAENDFLRVVINRLGIQTLANSYTPLILIR